MPPDDPDESAAISSLVRLLRDKRRLLVLTGAGVSTASGVPDYRDESGNWKHAQPMQFREFAEHKTSRQRYWARSYSGWQTIAAAAPNAAHRALARLGDAGRIGTLITQNVDGLHQRAGSAQVLDLHGRLDAIICLDCGDSGSRAEFQERLRAANPDWAGARPELRPDGDVDLPAARYEDFVVPACAVCDGRLKPDVVFFGEAVPRERGATAREALDEADALLVVGSSLMVFSGYRFARTAAARGIPVAAVNQGTTRADDLLDLKLTIDCTEVLPALADAMLSVQ